MNLPARREVVFPEIELRNKQPLIFANALESGPAPAHDRCPATVRLDKPARGFRLVGNAMAFAALLVMSGCGHPANPNSSATKSAPAQPSSFSFADGMARPLHSADVKVKLIQEHAPWLSADGTLLHVSVILVNHGAVTLSSQGKFPVTVVARLLGPTRKIVNDQLAVAHLPNPLPPDNSEAIEIKVPAAALADHRVALLPVQNGVGGFDQWGTKVLSLGPFVTCDPSGPRENTLCEDSGDPLLQIADEPSPRDDE